jgi:predicted aspartyl protease
MQNNKAFVFKGQGIVRALITHCGVCETFDPLTGTTHPKVFTFKALWDTGATGTVISKNVIDTIGLKPKGKINCFHADGQSLVDTYAINLFLPNQVAFPFVTVSEGKLTGFDLLIGMDIITKGDFSISNVGGKTNFTFRVPSIQDVDFTKENSEAALGPEFIGVQRNQPCPCKSGKKYKHCHGKAA